MNRGLLLAGLTAVLLLGAAAANADEPRFSMDYRNARVEDVLRALVAQAGLGLVSSGEVQGTVTLKLKNVTFDEALAHVADATGITYSRNEDVLTVNPKGVRTRAFVVRYVSAGSMKEAILKILSPQGTVEVFNGAMKDDANRTVAMGPANTLVVRDNDTKLTEVEHLVAALDRRPRQINIEAKLVEVTLDNEDKLGFDWSLAAQVTGASVPTTFPFSKNWTGGDYWPTPNTNQQSTTSGSNSASGVMFPPNQLFPYPQNSDFTFGKLSAANFKVAMDFLHSKTNTNLVSNPKISTLENMPAEILVGTVVPIALYQTSQQTGVLQLSGYEEKRIGVKLSVNPRVTEDGRIVMTVHPEISEILEYRGQFNERPVTSNREATTEVMIKDGETLVIGGLVRETETVTDTKVPVLGDLPGLGALFSHRSKSKQKTDLMVFVTPHILPE